jgi:uncharacterized protein (DUF1800 family)
MGADMKIYRKSFNSKTIMTRGIAFLAAAALLASTLALTAGAQQKEILPSKLSEEQRILHVLNRLGFGPRPGDVEKVKSIGIENYVNQQLNPERIPDLTAESKVRNLATLNMTTAELYEKFPQPGQLLRQLERQGALPPALAEARENRVKGRAEVAPSAIQQRGAEVNNGESNKGPGNMQSRQQPAVARNQVEGNPLDNEKYRQALREYYQMNGLQPPQRIIGELQASRILRAVYSERQLQEVMVDFWTNHFNVFAGKGADRWLLVSYDRDTIRPHAMGKFPDLLLATAQSPAMLFYLDNFQSVSPNAQLGQRQRAPRNSLFGLLLGNRQQQPPQRQRRGINENYARELMELHTLGVDGGYTQRDVQEVARCFTGWTIFAPRGGGAAAAALMGEAARENAGKFYFAPLMHDDGEKVVLGHKIPAGGGIKDGLIVLDILAQHPSTARFIATKLVRHFVADDPPPSLVDRVASVYNKTGGDIREMLHTIFFSAEFNSPQAYRAKIKRPFELAVSAVRTLGAETNGNPQLHQWIARMGQPLYGFQTPNGYSDTAEAWVNTGALLERLNFGLALASNRIAGTRVDLKRLTGGQTGAEEKMMDRFIELVVAGDISAKTRETLLKQLNDQAIAIAPPSAPPAQMQSAGEIFGRPRQRLLAGAEANITDPVTKIVGLILGSPEFQRQ